MRTLEFGMGICQTNTLGESNLSNLIAALAGPGATLIYQKNGDKSKETRIMQRAYLDAENYELTEKAKRISDGSDTSRSGNARNS